LAESCSCEVDEDESSKKQQRQQQSAVPLSALPAASTTGLMVESYQQQSNPASSQSSLSLSLPMPTPRRTHDQRQREKEKERAHHMHTAANQNQSRATSTMLSSSVNTTANWLTDKMFGKNSHSNTSNGSTSTKAVKSEYVTIPQHDDDSNNLDVEGNNNREPTKKKGTVRIPVFSYRPRIPHLPCFLVSELQLVFLGSSPPNNHHSLGVHSSVNEINNPLRQPHHHQHVHEHAHLQSVYEMDAQEILTQYKEREHDTSLSQSLSVTGTASLSLFRPASATPVEEEWSEVHDSLEESDTNDVEKQVLDVNITQVPLNDVATDSLATPLRKSDSVLELMFESSQRRRRRSMSSDFDSPSLSPGLSLPSSTSNSMSNLVASQSNPSLVRSMSLTASSNTQTSMSHHVQNIQTLKERSMANAAQRISSSHRNPHSEMELEVLDHQSGSCDRDTKSTSAETATEYLVLDFSLVLGVDATAARSCFLTLVQLLRRARVRVVFAHLSESVHALLSAHGVIAEHHHGSGINAEDDSVVVMPTLDDALEWCEDQLLTRVSEKTLQSVMASIPDSNSLASSYQLQQSIHDNDLLVVKPYNKGMVLSLYVFCHVLFEFNFRLSGEIIAKHSC
jgi:hypothetical protein